MVKSLLVPIFMVIFMVLSVITCCLKIAFDSGPNIGMNYGKASELCDKKLDLTISSKNFHGI